uniref:TROVE domain-containing protein n=1 Tax=Plectus sambesii TaxID=2011161 RepID=A0A914WK85_9BILA
MNLEIAKDLTDIIEKGQGALLLKEIVDISTAGRAAKQNPTLYALALCARYKVQDTKTKVTNVDDNHANIMRKYYELLHKAAFEVVKQVCRIPTHLFGFVAYCEEISKSTGAKTGSTGWGRTMRSTIKAWYMDKDPMTLAMHITKYPQRNGWSHRDLLRLAHPKVNGDSHFEHEQIFRYIIKGESSLKRKRVEEERMETSEPKSKLAKLNDQLESKALNFIQAVCELKATTDENKAAMLIQNDGLVREHVPTELLNTVTVWGALLQNMPMTAMLRNLAKMTVVGLFENEDNDDASLRQVTSQLTNEAALKKAKIHPLNVLLASATYGRGHGDKGKLNWTPVRSIVTALEEAFYLSFKNVEPTGKRFCFALDVSGSMSSPIANSTLSCREAAAALALVGLRTEPHVETVAFCDKLTPLPFSKSWTLTRMIEYVGNMNFGATDCALPMIWAQKEKKSFDVFVVITDNETWFGKVHPAEALKSYRKKMNIPEAKLIVVGLQANKFTIADPMDPGMFDVAGFDSAVPELIRDFVLGNI